MRAQQPRVQLLEVARRLHLDSRFRPFTRCLECNGALAAVPKDDVVAQVPEGAWHSYDQFVRCRGCLRVYWPGTHYKRLGRLVDEVQAALRRAPE